MRKTVDSFKYAIEGIWQCIKTQRNFRVHISAAVGVALVAPYFSLTRVEIAILIFAAFLVMVSEMFNTSIEFLVDLKTRDRYKFAKYAKDIAAGAVAFASLCSVGIGIAILGRWSVLTAIFCDVIGVWYNILFAVLYLGFAALFIRGWRNGSK